MHGGNWCNGSGAGVSGLTSSDNHGGVAIGLRPAMLLPDAKGITWREFFRDVVYAVPGVLAFLSVSFLIMLITARHGIVPALLVIIIILMICPSQKDRGAVDS